jgi:glycosyltransferase involved in cell wall biosynthesis
MLTVCALTCQRPEGLERLLEGLASQEFTERPPLVKVLIVDNNPDASARSICEEWRDRLGVALTYVHEPRPGIAVARNRALESVDRDTEWIAFIDDDEVPASDWLECLLQGQRDFDADVVSGLVLPYFPTPPPPWVRRGRFFDMVRRRTGSHLSQSQTNNVMFRAAIVRELDLRFEERFVYGEDTVFFRMVADAGYSIVRVNEARVDEWIAEERLTIYREVMSRPWERARFVGKLAHKVILGGSLCSLNAVLPHHVVVRARCRLAYSLGVVETLPGLSGSRRLRGTLRDTAWSNETHTPPGGE